MILAPLIVDTDPAKHRGKNYFVGIDSQSNLTALKDPLKNPKFGHHDVSVVTQAYLETARQNDCTFTMQWLPSHVGIEGNEGADKEANRCRKMTPYSDQLLLEIEPATLRTFLLNHERTQFHSSILSDQRLLGKPSPRISACGLHSPDLRGRHQLSRSLQTLYTRWRLGVTTLVGSFPRRGFANYVPAEAPCRFCGNALETTLHLISNCTGTLPTRLRRGILPSSLRYDSRESILSVASLDAEISRTVPAEQHSDLQRIAHRDLSRARSQQDSAVDDSSTTPNEQRQRSSNTPTRFLLPLSPFLTAPRCIPPNRGSPKPWFSLPKNN